MGFSLDFMHNCKRMNNTKFQQMMAEMPKVPTRTPQNMHNNLERIRRELPLPPTNTPRFMPEEYNPANRRQAAELINTIMYGNEEKSAKAYNVFTKIYLADWKNADKQYISPFSDAQSVTFLLTLVESMLKNNIQERESTRRKRMTMIRNMLHNQYKQLILEERFRMLRLGGKQTRKYRKSRKQTRYRKTRKH